MKESPRQNKNLKKQNLKEQTNKKTQALAYAYLTLCFQIHLLCWNLNASVTVVLLRWHQTFWYFNIGRRSVDLYESFGCLNLKVYEVYVFKDQMATWFSATTI